MQMKEQRISKSKIPMLALGILIALSGALRFLQGSDSLLRPILCFGDCEQDYRFGRKLTASLQPLSVL